MQQHATGREWRTLASALLETTLAGVNPPCRGPQADLWTAETASSRSIAAKLCRGCPVLAECARAAEAVDEQWHVWAGIDRTTRAREMRRRGRLTDFQPDHSPLQGNGTPVSAGTDGTCGPHVVGASSGPGGLKINKWGPRY
jgi:Transcription factor WhiB